MSSRYLLFLFVVCSLILAPAAAVADESKLPLILKEDFEHGFSRWKTTDPDPQKKSVWKIIEIGPKGNHALRCTGISDYKPKYRSPWSFALLKDVEVTDFELTLRCQETHVDAGPHRDLCIFWGYQDPNHFYYAHLGAKADPHACQIFIVNDADRDDDHGRPGEGHAVDRRLAQRESRAQRCRRLDEGLLQRHEEAVHDGQGQNLYLGAGWHRHV